MAFYIVPLDAIKMNGIVVAVGFFPPVGFYWRTRYIVLVMVIVIVQAISNLCRQFNYYIGISIIFPFKTEKRKSNLLWSTTAIFSSINLHNMTVRLWTVTA